MGIREPAADRNGMLRMEDIRCGRVVDDDGFSEVTTDLGEVLLVRELESSDSAVTFILPSRNCPDGYSNFHGIIDDGLLRECPIGRAMGHRTKNC